MKSANYHGPAAAPVLIVGAIVMALVIGMASPCLAASEPPRLGVPPLLVSTAPAAIEDMESIGMLKALLTQKFKVSGFGPGGGAEATLLLPEAVGVSLAARWSTIADQLPGLAASYVVVQLDLTERLVVNPLGFLAESLQLIAPTGAGETAISPVYVYDLGGSIDSYLNRTILFFFPTTLPDGSLILDSPELRLRLWKAEVRWDMQKVRALLSVL